MKAPAKFLARFAAIIAFSFASVTAHALPILNGTTSAAEGLSNLEIGGSFYDVEFADNGSYQNTYGSDDPYYIGDAAGANSAIQAIIGALSTLNVTRIAGIASNAPHYLFVPYSTAVSFRYGGQASAGSTVWNRLGNFTTSPTQNWNNISYVHVRPAISVDEPAPLVALTLGLGALFLLKRKRAS